MDIIECRPIAEKCSRYALQRTNGVYILSFLQAIFIAPLPSPLLLRSVPDTVWILCGVSRRSATGNCELRTCPRSLHGGWSGSRTHNPPVERFRLYQCATTSNLL